MKILNLLQKLIADSDPYGHEHGERVAELAGRLAERAGVIRYSKLYKDIITAALIHDVGKYKIPDAVLRLQGDFLEPEREIMENHPQYSAELLTTLINGDISPLIDEQVVSFVLHHHQDFGGTKGYPLPQLKGDKIPLGARIIRICDTYDAATHNRGYRTAKTPFEALKDMEESQIKTEFADPQLLRLFLKMMREY